MKKNNFEVGIIISLVLFSFIIFGIYLLYDLYLSRHSYTILMNPYTILECKKWDCKNVSDKLIDYNNKMYNVFIDGVSIGEQAVYYDVNDKRFYVFDSNDDSLYDNNGNLFSYKGNAKIRQEVISSEIVDNEEINDLIRVTGESFNLDSVSKITKDFDNDKMNENLYVINIEIMESLSKSFLVYKDGNKYNILDKSLDNKDVSKVYISSIVDIFEDGKLEFIYTTEYFDNIGRCNVIYRLKGKKFVNVNDCEIVSD